MSESTPPVASAATGHPPGASAGVPVAAVQSSRVEAIDLARGIAVALMILSHGVNGLLSFEQFTDWGMVPVHAITKFSSTLFVLVFGIALAVIFLPKVDSPDWPHRRNRLLWRGLVVLFWYKALTVVEMYARHDHQAIVDTLLYRNFPSYVEILGFYAIALLWVPFFLPLWARMPAWLRWLSPVVMAFTGWWLLHNFDFWGVPQLQALVVEHPDYYTWGQLARGPLILMGLLIGGLLVNVYQDNRRRWLLAGALALVAVLLAAAFTAWAGDDLSADLQAIARNAGKHPPELGFMLFSLAGALGLLALALAGGNPLAKVLRPITVIGSNALMAFIVHITIIFVVFRDWLGYFHTITYLHALWLSLGLILFTAAWISGWQWIQRRSRAKP